MEKERAIELLQEQIEKAESLKRFKSDSPEFIKWRRDTEIRIEKIFSRDSRHINDFKNIRYSLSIISNLTPDSEFISAYRDGLEEAKMILHSMIQEIMEFGFDSENDFGLIDSISVIENLCHRFHLVARQLRNRHGSRTTIEIEDEYDVQDLFHSLLHLQFNDIRAEEWTPSYAGGSSRIDFLLKDEQIIIEIKKTRKGLGAREIGDQLIIDSRRYQSHPDCKKLVCFVYDPEGRIGNPRGVERDLSEKQNELPVITIIAPKGL